VAPETWNVGRNWRTAPARPGPKPIARPSPIAPPSTQSKIASPSTSAATFASVKPSVFSTASSGIRSRIACAIVLPVSSTIVKNTAPKMPVIIKPMSPTCFAY